MNEPILPPGRIYAWLLILLLIALSACTPDGEPAGPTLDEAQIYSACQITPKNVPGINTHDVPHIYAQAVPRVYSPCSIFCNASSAN